MVDGLFDKDSRRTGCLIWGGKGEEMGFDAQWGGK